MRRPKYESRRGREIDDEAEWPDELKHRRAGEVVQADTPAQHALEVLDDLHLFNERGRRLQVVASGVAGCAVRVLRGGIPKPRAEQGVAHECDWLPAWTRERARCLDGVSRHPERPGRRALPELEHHAIEAGLVRDPNRDELSLIA